MGGMAEQATHHHAHAAVPAGADDLADRLRARGLRRTPQREQVLAAVRHLGHATPEQIGDEVDGVDVATVYRTLELLEELDLVRHTHLGHGAPSYRPAEDQHIHVVCHECGKVVDADPSIVDRLEQQLADERGFRLDRAHLTVFGRCADCCAAEPAEREQTTTTGR
jgi:Fur family transcriptional regulator, ferric uptake regulator